MLQFDLLLQSPEKSRHVSIHIKRKPSSQILNLSIAQAQSDASCKRKGMGKEEGSKLHVLCWTHTKKKKPHTEDCIVFVLRQEDRRCP